MTHLHVHSCYSFLEGLAAPAELAQAASAAGMSALALTDHNSLTGAIEFYDACQSVGVRPILGLELDVAPPAHMRLPVSEAAGGRLVLLAMNLDGWGELCRLASARLEAPPDALPPALDFETFSRLASACDCLICLTGGCSGVAMRWADPSAGEAGLARQAGWLEALAHLFPGRLYIELQIQQPGDDARCERLAVQAARLDLPLVASQEIYFLRAEQAPLQRLATAMRCNTTLDRLPTGAAAPESACFVSIDDLRRRFDARWPGAVDRSDEIAGRCMLELPLGVLHFPDYAALSASPGEPAAPGFAANLLRQKAEAGVRQQYGEVTPALRQRLDHELETITSYGYSSLFLIMQEVLDFARSRGIPFSSRGSAASSLVAHCLGITSPDPLRLNLYFERFLNPARLTPPDIDTDLCSRRREEVIRFVYERYGEDRVAMVCTISRFRRRSALRETASAYGLPQPEVKELADSLPHRWYGPPGRDAGSDEPFADLMERFHTPLHQAIFRDAAALLGLPHHLSIHPGGVVISPGPMHDLVPTQVAAKGIRITQFDLESIERLGLIKMDLLGIRGLTVLGEVSRLLPSSENTGARSFPPRFGTALDTIPLEDPATSDAVRVGRTIGCFQIESPGMRATLREIQARSVDDLMAALALYRPGPLTGGLKDAFVRRHRKEEQVSHLHPTLAPLLEDTYGVILYQEQVLRIAHELAGLSLADADLLRRAMSHFDPGERMRQLKLKFIQGAREHSGVPEPVAGRVWEMMAAFAGYGFPKAHAASYAIVAWQAAWCKTHFPAEFLAAVLANWGGYYPQSVYLTEARRSGLALRPPDVNYARGEFSAQRIDDQPVLIMGLDQVRDLTHRTQQRILQGRPFHSLQDFLARADPRPQEAENLASCGALEAFGPVPALLETIRSRSWKHGQLSLFDMGALSESPQGTEDWSLEEKVAAQQAVLGASIAAHPLELAASSIAAANALTTVEAAAHVGQSVRVAGMRQTWRRSTLGNGEHVYFMAFEDLEGMLDVVLFADVYRRSRAALDNRGPYLVSGQVELDHTTGEPFIRAERVDRLG